MFFSLDACRLIAIQTHIIDLSFSDLSTGLTGATKPSLAVSGWMAPTKRRSSPPRLNGPMGSLLTTPMTSSTGRTLISATLSTCSFCVQFRPPAFNTAVYLFQLNWVTYVVHRAAK